MRVCLQCSFPAMIAGDYGGPPPIPCANCGGTLGDWAHRDSPKMREADREWFAAKRKRDAAIEENDDV